MFDNPSLQARMTWAANVVQGLDLLDGLIEVLDCKLSEADP